MEVVVAGLAGVGGDDDAAGGADHGGLDERLGLVGGGEAARGGEAVGADDGDVDDDAVEGVGGPVADGRAGDPPHPATEEVEA